MNVKQLMAYEIGIKVIESLNIQDGDEIFIEEVAENSLSIVVMKKLSKSDEIWEEVKTY